VYLFDDWNVRAFILADKILLLSPPFLRQSSTIKSGGRGTKVDLSKLNSLKRQKNQRKVTQHLAACHLLKYPMRRD